MDGWFLPRERKPTTASEPKENRVHTPTPERARRGDRPRHSGTGHSMPSSSSGQGRCGLDIAFYGPRCSRQHAGVRPGVAAELIRR